MTPKAVTTMRRLLDGWGRRLHERAVDNARDAATEASRVLVERAEVESYLAHRRDRTEVAARAL